MTGPSRVAWRESGKGAEPALSVLIVLIVAAWLLAVVLGGLAGEFESGPSRPPLPILAAVAVPPGGFGLVYGLSPQFRDFVLSLDLRMLTAAQSWRVIGGMFIFLRAFDLRPALFAFPAGLGGVAVGIAAVFVLRAVINRRDAGLPPQGAASEPGRAAGLRRRVRHRHPHQQLVSWTSRRREVGTMGFDGLDAA